MTTSTASALRATADATSEAEAEARDSARAAGLRYVSDAAPGIRRERSGDGFVFRKADGTRVTSSEEVARIKHLAIPPAWTDVWICPRPDGHIQATGRDKRGRKQYRYHDRWREVRDAVKYGRMIEFGQALPRIRARVEKDLALPGLPRERVLAAVVRLLDLTLIRVGNEEYARQNRSYGLTTLRNRHLDVQGTEMNFEFRGKSGQDHRVSIRDRRLAGVLRQCQDLPGQELFQYVDPDGERRSVDSGDVNEYIEEAAGAEFTAKDFRTWAGTVLAAGALRELGPGSSERETRRLVVEAVGRVARRLGNTPAVCRRCYIHPDVIEAHADGGLLALRVTAPRTSDEPSLRPEEAAVLRLLRKRVARGDRARARREITPRAS